MFSLPGLNLSSQPAAPLDVPATVISRTQELAANTEYRFEVSFTRSLTVKLQSGAAEFFGTELAPSTTYTFRGTKGAIYTWHGCKLEIGGEVESDYVAEETPMTSFANLHFALEAMRDRSAASGGAEMGPQVLIVGPENAGKTALVKILTAYALKSGRQPTVINLDPRQGMLSVPGSFTAATYSSILDIEEGWGSSPISGPSPIPVKMPLVYHYGLKDTEEGKNFRPLVTRMALAVTSRLEEDGVSKQAGFIIDSGGAISQGRNGVYDNIEHIVSEFSVNIVITLGSERLSSDLSRRLSARPSEEPIAVLRLDKSGGCVDRSDAYMKALRHAQIREYFFGQGENALAPSSQSVEWDSLAVFQIGDGSEGLADDDNPLLGSSASSSIFTRVATSPQLQNALLAVTTASPADSHAVIRDASIRGYIYVADVDEARKKIRVLSPQPGRIPPNALLWGDWPEEVPGLVN